MEASEWPFAVRPIKGLRFGAEVVGLDLEHHEDLGAILPAVHSALNQHMVLVFRDQQGLSPARHVEFSERFGGAGLYHYIRDEFRMPGFPGIVVISNEVVDGRRIGVDGQDQTVDGKKYYWHSDLSYLAEPPMASCLLVRNCPGPEHPGNRTRFIDMYAAYEALRPDLKQRLRGLKAVHVFTNKQARDERGVPLGMTEEQAAKVVEVVHPVVRTHPETGRDCIFVSTGFTKEIVGMGPLESQALLSEVNNHVESGAFTIEHHWRPGDMVLWDNRCTIHIATSCEAPRTLHRTTIKAKPPHHIPKLYVTGNEAKE